MEDDEHLRAAQSRIGLTLRGKYRIDAILGVGGMAVVYAATHRNQAEFAIKILHPDLSRREDVRTRFLREGYAANSVKHPGVVQVVDDDIAEDGAAFLVMELLRGKCVEALWESNGGRLPAEAAAIIVLQLLEVLAAAHEKAIVHRDIKPANLFLLPDGTLKVLDFGIARARDAAMGGKPDGKGTGTGMLLGTPAFMSPEQALAQSGQIDAPTDVWAAAATFFALTSGQLVHLGENATHQLILAATTPARPLLSVAPHVPPPVAQVIDAGLSFEKTARWPTATAMRDALRAAVLATYGALPERVPLQALTSERVAGFAATHAPMPHTPMPYPPSSGFVPPLVQTPSPARPSNLPAGSPFPAAAGSGPLPPEAPAVFYPRMPSAPSAPAGLVPPGRPPAVGALRLTRQPPDPPPRGRRGGDRVDRPRQALAGRSAPRRRRDH